MKTLILTCLLLICFSCVCSGGVVLDDGLVLQGGAESIEMRVGERVYLKIQDSIWKYPVVRDLEFSSSKPWVAYADDYGWIHAESAGRTVISVWNDSGANGTVEVIVHRGVRAPLWAVKVVFVLLLGAIAVFCGANFFRCFE